MFLRGLMSKRQIVILIKTFFSHHNLCFKYLNEKCELIFNIYFTNTFSIIYRRFNVKKNLILETLSQKIKILMIF
jgi:hypothetical protein